MLFTLLLTAILLAPAQAQDPSIQEPGEIPPGVAQEEGDYITLRFTETEGERMTIAQYIKLCQQVTGRNFTIDTDSNRVQTVLGQQVLLYGPKRLRKDQFYSFFQVLMKINGLVCVQQGAGDLAVIMITSAKLTGNTPNPEVAANAILVEPDLVQQFAHEPGTYIATVVKLKWADPTGISPTLGKLLGQSNNAVQALTNDRALMIQGYGPLVASAVRFVRYLDVEPDIERAIFKKVRLEEASAEEMAEQLSEIIEDIQLSANPQGPRVVNSRSSRSNTTGPNDQIIETKILANPRDNSLIITASERNMPVILNLVAQLDLKVEVPESNLHLFMVQHLPVEELAEDLKEFLRRAEEAVDAAQSTGNNTIVQNEQDIVVWEQEETNSLMVSATRSRWASLKMLLERLDRPQPQVLIETALIEISEDFTREIGIEFANSEVPGENSLRGSITTNFGISSADQNGDRAVNIFEAGITAGVLDGQGNGEFAIPFLLRAAETSGNANVLSKPSVLVSNNKGATVASTDEVPFSTSTLGQVGQQQNVEYQEAGITLGITPSISSSSFLRLEISLVVSSFRSSGDPDLPPPITSRTITTEVMIPDGSTMWIGGIVRDDQIKNDQGVPFLNKIPILGILFGRKTNQTNKTTLFFFCTPHIIGDFQELSAISERGKAEAAETIGLERLRLIDPNYRLENPADVILESGDAGMLDPGMIQAPVLIAPGGEVDPSELQTPDSDPLTYGRRIESDPRPVTAAANGAGGSQ